MTTPELSEARDEEAAPGARSPYQNLWVPLVIVPALVVVALVLVFVFFGAIAGTEETLSENLHKVVTGGSNERTQAAFNLSRQVAENQRAQAEGRPEPWPIEEGFRDDLRRAWESVSAEDHEIRLVLAYLMTRMEDPEGLPNMLSLLELTDAEDPEGRVRFNTMANLGAIGDERAAAGLMAYLEHPDPGLRSAAAIGLQKMLTDDVRQALRGAVSDDDFDVRANAAISLSHMRDPYCADLLKELAGAQAYELEHERDQKRYARADTVRESRLKAIDALGRLDRNEHAGFFEELAQDPGSDLLVREAAMRMLADRNPEAGPGGSDSSGGSGGDGEDHD